MKDAVTLTVNADGSLCFLYDDELADLFADDGDSETRRASHVEPQGTGWVADLSPVGGPFLIGFRTRQAALDAECRWLIEHHIPFPQGDATDTAAQD